MAASYILRKFTTTRCTTASPFITKLLHHKISPTTSTRSLSTIPSKDYQKIQNKDSSKPPLVVTGPPEAFKYEHPFQTRGGKDVVEVNATKDGTLIRVALPGVGENGYKVWVENDTVYFQGKADVDLKDEQAKVYGGSLQFPPELYKAEGVKSDIKNGVLKLLVPNADGVDFKDKDK